MSGIGMANVIDHAPLSILAARNAGSVSISGIYLEQRNA